ncbi:MAG TPA: hypothetical protein VI112_01750 [Bacteroidia bacterium]|jgi:hypothetical protein
MKHLLKILLFLFLLWWPVSYALHFSTGSPLHGEFTAAGDVQWNWADWQEGKYQEGKEKFLNENFTQRNTAVRLHNEIIFHAFDKAQSRSTIVGRSGYVFGKDYIDSWFGFDFIGSRRIKTNIQKLELIRDSLKAHGTDLLLVVEPGKGSFYHEFFPSYSDGWKKDSTNYETYVHLLKGSRIPLIDMNSWFLKLKENSPYTLYTKTGIHWSDYGMTLAMDSLIHYIEQMRHIDMPDMTIRSLRKDSVSEGDMDVEMGMNLLFGIPKPPMVYPVIDFNEEKKAKPHVIVIGDSFFWQPLSSGLAAREFAELEFWYYFYQVNFAYQRAAEDPPSEKIPRMLKQDVVILMCSDAKLSNLGWGFIDVLCDEFVNSTLIQKRKDEERVHFFEDKIRKDANWLEQVRQKAIKNKVSLDEMIHEDAVYLLNEEKKNH